MNRNLLFCLLFLAFVKNAWSQSVLGYWKTIDDVTAEPKSILQVFKEEDGLSARIIEILVDGGAGALCEKCEGSKKNKPIEGMTIFDDLEKLDDHTYGNGKILDPESGREYRVKIWLDPEKPDQLKVRGYVSFFFRTQTWQRVSP